MAHSTSTPSPSAEHEDSPVDLNRFLKWLGPVITGVLALALIFLWQQQKGSGVRSEALLAYTDAQTAEELENVASAYPKQPEAPLALLEAAAERFSNNEFDASLNAYQSFLSLYANHALREYAEWGLWMSQEQLGELDSALNGFRSVGEEDLLYPQALLAQARILEKQSSPEKAIEVYTTVKETFPESPWAQQALIFSRLAAQNVSE